MKAVNLTLQPVELDPVNGGGLLLPAVPESDGEHVRELVELTDRERALADAGTIMLEGDPPSPDAYDRMDRDRLLAEAERRGLEVQREDGRTDLPPKESELRHALRVADVNPGGERA